MKTKRRIVQLDVLRGFGIYLSVLGHCITYGNGSAFKAASGWQQSVLYRVIYSFHMPLLAAISGIALWYSLKGSTTPSLKSAARKLSHLVVPILSWGIFSSFFYYIFAPSRFPTSLVQFFWTCEEAYWFLSAMVICITLTFLLKDCLHNHPVAFIALFGLFFLLPDTHSTAAQKTMFFYYYLFFLLAQFVLSQIDSPDWKKLAFITLLAFVIYLVLFPWFTADKTFHVFSIASTDAPVERILHVVKRVLLGTSGLWLFSVLFLLLSHFVPFVEKLFAGLGKQSLGIYVLSSWIIEWGLQKLTRDFSYSTLQTVVESVIVTGICYALTILLRKIPVVDYLFFGGSMPKNPFTKKA